jgi:hypothetical protein
MKILKAWLSVLALSKGKFGLIGLCQICTGVWECHILAGRVFLFNRRYIISVKILFLSFKFRHRLTTFCQRLNVRFGRSRLEETLIVIEYWHLQGSCASRIKQVFSAGTLQTSRSSCFKSFGLIGPRTRGYCDFWMAGGHREEITFSHIKSRFFVVICRSRIFVSQKVIVCLSLCSTNSRRWWWFSQKIWLIRGISPGTRT